jgi:hypothetical protein
MIEAFDLLYMLVATGGRDKELFGENGELLHKTVEKAFIGECIPDFYLEFPLAGKPSVDLLTLYGKLPSPLRLGPGCGFGYEKMLDWYSTLPSGRGYYMGFEMDTGLGPTDKAGIYFQPRRSLELVEPFLKTVGEEKRASSYLELSEHLPPYMSPSYIGLFPGRPDFPMRIGGYMSAGTSKDIAEAPALLRNIFEAAGFKSWNAEMLSICRDLYSAAKDTDFQFDIYPDGSIGDTYGLDISLRHIKTAKAAQWILEGNGSVIMTKLKDYGLIDDRYKKLADIPFAKGIPVERKDGSICTLGLSVQFSDVKVKFRAGKPMTAKFYLRLNFWFV